MSTEPIAISFPLQLEQTAFVLLVSADVIWQPGSQQYLVGHLRTATGRNVLPDCHLKKIEGKWVHADSERESNLSAAVGQAYDALEEVNAIAKRSPCD
jgi:hypothetical protein